MGQFYEPLSIGTAKPDWKHHKIPHHFFDYIAEPRNFTVAEYRQLVHKKMEEIWQRNALPVVVGGSLFYLKALFFLSDEVLKKNPQESADHLSASDAQPAQLWQQLYEIDSDRALKIDKNDVYRIKRALQIWYESGIKPSLYGSQYKPLGKSLVTFVTRERGELYQRIDERVLTMFEQGWVAETASLSPEWRSFLLEKKLLGYPEIIHLCEKKSHMSQEAIIQLIQQKTRNYAKRQITFWRSLKESIEKQGDTHVQCEELDLTLSSVDLYLNHIQHIIDDEVKGLR